MSRTRAFASIGVGLAILSVVFAAVSGVVSGGSGGGAAGGAGEGSSSTLVTVPPPWETTPYEGATPPTTTTTAPAAVDTQIHLTSVSPPLAAVTRWTAEADACATSVAPPQVILALIETESTGRPDAVSPAGAIGLTQLMPATAREYGVADPWDPRENVCGGARVLSSHLTTYGDLTTALVAYNAGPGNVARGTAPRSSYSYAQRVQDRSAAYGDTYVPPAPQPQSLPSPPPGAHYLPDGRLVPWGVAAGDITPEACANSLLKLRCDSRAILSSTDLVWLCSLFYGPGFYWNYHADNRIEELTGGEAKLMCPQVMSETRSIPAYTG